MMIRFSDNRDFDNRLISLESLDAECEQSAKLAFSNGLNLRQLPSARLSGGVSPLRGVSSVRH